MTLFISLLERKLKIKYNQRTNGPVNPHLNIFPGITTTVNEKKGNIDFLDAQGQLTLWTLIRSGQISKSSNLWEFFHMLRGANSAGSSQIWPNFEFLRALMHVIITCKYEKEQIKNSREKVATRFFPSYPYLLPWKPVVGSGQISNSSKLSCMSSLCESMKWIQSRTA